jgi:hypothetical protein
MLWQVVVEICLLGTVLAQSTTTSYGLLYVITKAESGLLDLISADAAESASGNSKVASSIGLGGVISIAGSGLNDLTSANAAQSSRASAGSQASSTKASASATDSANSSRSSASSSGPSKTASSISQAKPTSPSDSSSAGSSTSSSAAASSGGGGHNHTLAIVLGTVLGILALVVIILFLACCLARRRRRQKRIARRTLTPESEEVDSWRGRADREIQYAQLPPGTPTGGAFLHNERLSSHPYPIVAPDLRQHPAMREEPSHNHQHQNPFVPVPPPPRRGAPNARPGLTDASVPGDDPYIGATVMRPRSRSMSSSRQRRSNSQQRLRGGIDSTYFSTMEPPNSTSPPNSGLNNHPTSTQASDLPPQGQYRDSRPATPMALKGFGPSVSHTGAMNPDASHIPVAHRPPANNSGYANYHEYDFVPPRSRSPARSPALRPTVRPTGTPPLLPSRSPKRVSFSLDNSQHNSASNSNSETASTDSAGRRMSQMPGSFDTPHPGPSTPTRSPVHGYFPGEQSRHSNDGGGSSNSGGNGNRILRLSDLRQAEERDWYLRNHQDGYGVGTAL